MRGEEARAAGGAASEDPGGRKARPRACVPRAILKILLRSDFASLACNDRLIRQPQRIED